MGTELHALILHARKVLCTASRHRPSMLHPRPAPSCIGTRRYARYEQTNAPSRRARARVDHAGLLVKVKSAGNTPRQNHSRCLLIAAASFKTNGARRRRNSKPTLTQERDSQQGPGRPRAGARRAAPQVKFCQPRTSPCAGPVCCSPGPHTVPAALADYRRVTVAVLGSQASSWWLRCIQFGMAGGFAPVALNAGHRRRTDGLRQEWWCWS